MHSVRNVLGLIMPGILLGLVPKCPACVAAYIALATGITVSVSTASHLRMSLIVIGGVTIFMVAWNMLRRWVRPRVPS